jgi:hypothetical protein
LAGGRRCAATRGCLLATLRVAPQALGLICPGGTPPPLAPAVPSPVRGLFNLIAWRKAMKRRYATRDNSNASDRGLEVHGYLRSTATRCPRSGHPKRPNSTTGAQAPDILRMSLRDTARHRTFRAYRGETWRATSRVTRNACKVQLSSRALSELPERVPCPVPSPLPCPAWPFRPETPAPPTEGRTLRLTPRTESPALSKFTAAKAIETTRIIPPLPQLK